MRPRLVPVRFKWQRGDYAFQFDSNALFYIPRLSIYRRPLNWGRDWTPL